jgi:hypothetical protein
MLGRMVSDKTKHDSDVKARDSVAKRAVETLGTHIATTNNHLTLLSSGTFVVCMG